MTLDELKTAVSKMAPAEQDKVAAYLVHLRHQREGIPVEPSAWITLEELRRAWSEQEDISPNSC